MADDTELTIALAEYAHLRELSRTVHDQSTARFTFFLAVASGATAVSAGLITTGTPGDRVGPAVLAGLGLLVVGQAGRAGAHSSASTWAFQAALVARQPSSSMPRRQ